MQKLTDKITTLLLAWYREHARVLPWRGNVSPYGTWVSEIMLQQTRVDTVIDYYRRFMKALPDIKALAECDDETLHKLWEGLGYYRRVRYLREAAGMVVRDCSGKLPDDIAALRKLPGIGEYTAGAIASIAFNQPEVAVDGNVLRVLARITGDDRDITEKQVKEDFSNALRAIYPKDSCGDFTQSLMELGAIVCVPNGAPRCDECPLKNNCVAYREKRTDTLPVKSAKAKAVREKRTILLLQCSGHLALRRRPADGLLASMWEPPSVDGHADEKTLRNLPELSGLDVVSIEPVGEAIHRFTHRHWEMKGFRITCRNMPENFRWATKKELEQQLALPTAFKFFVKQF